MKIDTEPRKNEHLQHCSPEFQENVKREQESAARAAKKEEARRLRRKTLYDFVKGIAFLFLIGLAFAFLYSGFTSLDQAGWITHNHDTPVWIQGDWLVGEYRDCQMRTKTVPEQRKDLDSLDKLPRLFCSQDADGLFDFQRATALVAPPPDVQAPPQGNMYLFTVTSSELDHEFHTMPARYNGRIDREDKCVISWRCQRKSDSLTCNALN
jgi:hypothetical protein